jgi:DNA-binding transcriptional LysR family regulator
MNLKAVELSHLRYFIALAEELHFGRAAARLNMAQPPLTRQIHLLEERLECRLFDRNSRSTRLTPAGTQLLERARGIVAEADLALESVRKLGRGEDGHLTLATAPSLMLGALPRVIRVYRKKYPRVDFRLSETASSSILQAVRGGSADLGLIRGTEKDAEIETHVAWKEDMVAIVPNDFPVRHGAAMTVSELRGEPFVFFPRHVGPSFHDEVTGHCQRAGFAPAVVQEARQWSSIVSLVSAGMGVSIGPASLAKMLPKAAKYLPLKGFRTAVGLVSRAGDSNPALRNFVAVAGKAFGEVAR